MRQALPSLGRCWSVHCIVDTGGAAVVCAVGCGASGAGRAADLPATAQAPATAKALQRYSLTVRGGVSLGAYEGGINWALLRVLQGDPTASLTTVTGASAGNINAFLSAVEWCQDPARSAAETP